jgi:hypothetical protein
MEHMHLKLILPGVNPAQITKPEKCPYKKCNGKHFKMRQEVQKAVRDSKCPAWVQVP